MRGYLWLLLCILLGVLVVIAAAIYGLACWVKDSVRRHEEEPFFAPEFATPTPRPAYTLSPGGQVLVTAHGVRIPLLFFDTDEELDDWLATLEEINRIEAAR